MIQIYNNGTQRLDEIIFRVNKPLIGKRGIHYQKLLKDWYNIVGTKIAKLAVPVKISSVRHKSTQENVLHLATNNSSVGIEMSYHLGVIKEQINLYLGYEYIQQIRLVQAVFSTLKNSIPKEILFSKDDITKAIKLTEEYLEEDDIKKILMEMAKNISHRNNL